MTRKDDKTFQEVLEGIRKGAGKPKDGKASPEEIKRAKQLHKKQMKRDPYGDVIDTGMFDN